MTVAGRDTLGCLGYTFGLQWPLPVKCKLLSCYWKIYLSLNGIYVFLILPPSLIFARQPQWLTRNLGWHQCLLVNITLFHRWKNLTSKSKASQFSTPQEHAVILPCFWCFSPVFPSVSTIHVHRAQRCCTPTQLHTAAQWISEHTVVLLQLQHNLTAIPREKVICGT